MADALKMLNEAADILSSSLRARENVGSNEDKNRELFLVSRGKKVCCQRITYLETKDFLSPPNYVFPKTVFLWICRLILICVTLLDHISRWGWDRGHEDCSENQMNGIRLTPLFVGVHIKTKQKDTFVLWQMHVQTEHYMLLNSSHLTECLPAAPHFLPLNGRNCLHEFNPPPEVLLENVDCSVKP